jgi:hypothetical protein
MFIPSRKIRTGTGILAACVVVFAQEPPGTVLEAAKRHFDPSTIAFRQTTIHLPGSHLSVDTAMYSFEADIAPEFTLFRAALGGPLGGSYMLTTGGRFTIRRADALPSNPVRTPGYTASGTLFYSPYDSIGARRAYAYASLSVSHYSNGQTGDFLRADGSINDVDGSFSLWSASAAIHLFNDWPLLPEYKSLQLEYLYGKEGALEELYPDYVLSLALHTREHAHQGWWGFAGSSRVLMDFEARLPNGGSRPASMKPEPLSAAITYAYGPRWFGLGRDAFPGLSLFGRFYAGSDYYNINFAREIYRVDFGLMFSLY